MLFLESLPSLSFSLLLSPLLVPRLPLPISSGSLSLSMILSSFPNVRVLGLPHLTLPFILTSWAFLLFSTEMVIRPEKLSTPEEHLAQHKKRRSWETLVLGALVRQSTALSVLPAAAGGDDILPSAVANVKGLQDGSIP